MQTPIYMPYPVNMGKGEKKTEKVYIKRRREYEDEDYEPRRRESAQPVVQPIIITPPQPQAQAQPYMQPVYVQQPMGQPIVMGQPISQPMVMGQPMGQPVVMGQPISQPQSQVIVQSAPQPQGQQNVQPQMIPQNGVMTTTTTTTIDTTQSGKDGKAMEYGSEYRYGGIYDKVNGKN